MMIPLRHNLTISEHRTLPFPEGTACAKVLIAGDTGGASAYPVFLGIGLGALYQFAMKGLRLWQDSVLWSFASLQKATIGFELTPIFLGVGYLIGPQIASYMLLGGVLGWVVLIPTFNILAGGPIGEIFGCVKKFISFRPLLFGAIYPLCRCRCSRHWRDDFAHPRVSGYAQVVTRRLI